MFKRTQTIKAVMCALIANISLVAQVQAQGHDYFAHMTPGPQTSTAPTTTDKPIVGSMAIVSQRTPTVEWFEKFDHTVFLMRATDADKVTLNRPFDKQAERVQQWILVAGQIVKRYRLLAMTIRNMPIPSESPDLHQFRDMNADWFTDVAGVYADLIRPRTPPKTQEELESQSMEVQERAISLGTQQRKLREMDNNLRKQYGVHANADTDALYKYVNSGRN